MVPLSEDLQSTITKNMLIVRGKELSAKQHDRVIGCKQTENPLFLMILLQVKWIKFGLKDLNKLKNIFDTNLST